MIYTVTLVDMQKFEKSDTWVIRDKYVVGYFFTLDNAIKAIENNNCGMFDRYYWCKYATIKECDEGIYGWRNIVRWLRNSIIGIKEIKAPVNL